MNILKITQALINHVIININLISNSSVIVPMKAGGMRSGGAGAGSSAGFLKANTLSRSTSYTHRQNNSAASRREGGIKVTE